MATPWAAIAQGVSNLGGSLIQNAGNKKAQRRANRYNVGFWNMQNDYNHPSAQMARLREAGLNPNLIYGNSASGASGQAERIAPAKPAEFKFESPLNNIRSIADVKQTTQQTDNLRAQNTVLQQEAILKAAQTSEIGTKTARGKFDLGLATQLKDTSLQAAKANLRSMEQTGIQKTLDNEIKSESKRNLVKDITYRVENAKATLKGQKLLNALRHEELELKRLGIERGDNMFFRIFGKKFDDAKSSFKKRSRRNNPFNPYK